MPMSESEILVEAMALEPKERDEVAEALWQSLAPGELASEQMAEIHRRIAALDSEAQPVPGEQVLRERFRR